jgi:hypothetical protein
MLFKKIIPDYTDSENHMNPINTKSSTADS